MVAKLYAYVNDELNRKVVYGNPFYKILISNYFIQFLHNI